MKLTNRLKNIKKKYIWLLFILCLAVFLRAYHFSDWLHFELDQSRDAKVIDLAVREGPENLPLLGPKAAGSFLRLGPIFYYFKYLSALIFGNTPSGIAAIILIFGILAVPTFYCYIKRYFNEKMSLGLTLLFSVSIFLVVYSRFSWNPNPLVLFVILTFYGLLRSVDLNEKKKGYWLLLSSFALTVCTQLHFLAFVAIPVIYILFLIIKRPRIRIWYWLGSILIVVILYSPAILNDIKTGGDNIGQFLKVTDKKSGKDNHNILEKIAKNYTENSLGYLLLISGQTGDLPKFKIKQNEQDISCDRDCRSGLFAGALSLIVFTFGLILLFKNTYFEKNQIKKDFLLLNSLWFSIAFGIFTVIAFDISPRFWLLISALPFIFLGLILELIGTKFSTLLKDKTGFAKGFVAAIIFLLAASNIYEIKKRSWQLANAPYQAFDIPTDKILKERTRVTLKQQYLIVNYIKNIYDQNRYPVYLNSEPFYRRSFIYHFDQMNIPGDDFRNATNNKKVYEKGNYFLIYPTLSNFDSDIQKYLGSYDLKNKKEFGTLTITQMSPKKEAINAIEQEFKEEGDPKSAPGVPVRYRWEQIFDENADEESDN